MYLPITLAYPQKDGDHQANQDDACTEDCNREGVYPVFERSNPLGKLSECAFKSGDSLQKAHDDALLRCNPLREVSDHPLKLNYLA